MCRHRRNQIPHHVPDTASFQLSRIPHRVSDVLCLFICVLTSFKSPILLFFPFDTMVFMQKRVCGEADDYHQTVKAVDCITGKLGEVVEVKSDVLIFSNDEMKGRYIVDFAVSTIYFSILFHV